jgi:K+-transporting ATPase KdpF subunit
MNQKVTVSFMLLAVIPETAEAAVSKSPSGYLIGGIIALLILGYLVYTLVRPDKF